MNSGTNRNQPTNLVATVTGMGIRGRLLLGFGTITGIFLVAIIITAIIVTLSKNSANEVIQNDLPTFSALQNLSVQLAKSQAKCRGMIVHDSEILRKEFTLAWTSIITITRTLDGLKDDWKSTQLVNDWLTIKPMLSELRTKQLMLVNSIKPDASLEDLRQKMDISNGTMNKIQDILEGEAGATGARSGGMSDKQMQVLTLGTEGIIDDITMVQWTQVIIVIVGILASILVAIVTTRSIIQHINVFRGFSNKIATGDLRQTLSINSNDEIGLLGKDLNLMTEGLSGITKQITEACQQMVTSLLEVKQAVDQQSSGATEQASSINQITVSLEEIEKSSAQTMDKAKSLGQTAERTREKGQLGLAAVEQSIQGMKSVREKVQLIAQTILELSNQTQQVGEITAVVNNLAQQSKMLALNAAIEAAKAGEAGKGFAVVATEVKNLAEQSERSTAQVQKILEDIRHATEKAVMVTEEGTKGVDLGTSLVEQTGEIVRSLTEVIHETTISSQQIEAAVRQEGVGIEQIASGMNEINQVTASFVASANQTLEAINQLSAITKNLKEHVDIYKV